MPTELSGPQQEQYNKYLKAKISKSYQVLNYDQASVYSSAIAINIVIAMDTLTAFSNMIHAY